ncbi:TetR family transcriptional regulator [Rhodococcus sp. ARC_M12]|uniref:TetR family transcriptional regulator n=1 Tax=Rhodococcus navarretei TaxID=3128981 RepID=A0ABU9D391_9NOCA|nr:TetR family transcriptional regulator [Rhodococcus sp. ARC_M12]MCJ0979970.1 TetR family transcriptional regulator [Rhodococcus sp. ARC_M12]
MKPDASATRARIVIAARDEFSEHGLAGARVDRIAVAAKASKERLYAYFGDKETLFRAVVEDGFARFIDEVPFAVDDLGGYAAREYLHLAAHPEEHRLLLWTQLQGGTATSGTDDIRSVIAQRRSAMAVAQQEGLISDAFTVDDLFTMIFGITSAWMTAPGSDCGPIDDTEHQRRASKIEGAVRRLCAP